MFYLSIQSNSSSFSIAKIFSGDPISLINSGTSMSPSFWAKSKIVGFKSSTKPCSAQGFLKTAATEMSKTGSSALFPPSIKFCLQTLQTS